VSARCAALLFASLLAFLSGPVLAQGAVSEPLTWLTDYLRIDTRNPPGNEHLAISFLRDLLHSEGISTQVMVTPAGRPSLVARLAAATDSDRGALVLLHHIDVVPPGPGWSKGPFSGHRQAGILWGRGAVDDKSLGIAHLAGFVDLKRDGVRLNRDVVFMAVSDEEAGGKEGTGWLWENHPDLFEGIAAVLGEGGTNRVVNGIVFWWGIEVAQKRPLWLKTTARGRGGHGSSLKPRSAPHRLVSALDRLVRRPLTYRVTPPARRYLESVAPYQSQFFQQMVADLDEIVLDSEPHRRIFPGVPAYLLDTVQVNVLSAGERVNVIPREASAFIDARLLPDTDDEVFLAEIQALLGEGMELEVLLRSPPVQPSPADHEVFRHLEEVLGGTAPVVPAFIPGVTDSRYFRARGIPAYGFSPFLIEGSDLTGIHGADERISIDVFGRGVETMRKVLRACAVD
jgi:acetylornithine deacetylase/succinyl-diaminopimelate desuccinylase-like protein